MEFTDILPESVELLRTHRTMQKRQALEGGWSFPEMVFDFKGGYDAQNRVRRAFKKVLVAAKLPHHRIQDTRHSYCSQLVSRGVSTAYVAKQVGDTEEVVRKVYTHWIKDAAEPEVAALAGVWN